MANRRQRNRVLVTCTAPSGTGTYTLGSAVTGYQAPRAADDGVLFSYTAWEVDGSAIPNGDWESGVGTYTHSGTTLARTKIHESSNSDGAVSWAGEDLHVAITPLANDEFALIAGTDAATTCVANSMYVVDMSAWATADRNYTMPASPVIGDPVGIMVTSGNASFELIIKGNTSQTINGGSSASEWSRLFITGEMVELRYVASNTWIVETDKRIPMAGLMHLSTQADGESAAALTYPTSAGGAWTADTNRGSCMVTATDKVIARRACYADLSWLGRCKDNLPDGEWFGVYMELNAGATVLLGSAITSSQSSGTTFTAAGNSKGYPMAVDDYFRYQYIAVSGGKGLAADLTTQVSFTEILR